MATNQIKEILQKIRIEEVIGEHIDLSKKGKNFWSICPFHEDNNPSLSVSPDKNIFKCFVCGQGGNAINFLTEFLNISYGQALSLLAKKVGIEYTYIDKNAITYTQEEQKLIDVFKDATEYFQYMLQTDEGAQALKYLTARQIDSQTIEQFKIGFAPAKGLIQFLLKKGHDEATLINAYLQNQKGNAFFHNKLIFPIFNRQGDVIAFSGRKLGAKEGPKYINSGESIIFKKSQTFYNLNNAINKINKDKELYIAEGFFDVIAMDRSGFINTLAIMGTALTNKHLEFLKQKRIYMLLDSDDAGIQATIKSANLLLAAQIDAYVIYNKTQKDPDEIFTKDRDGLKHLVRDNKHSLLEFIYAVFKKKINPTTPSTMQKFIVNFYNFLKHGTSLEKDFYRNKIAEEFKISAETIQELIPYDKIRRNTYYQPAFTTPKTSIKLDPRQKTADRIIKSVLHNKNFAKLLDKYQSYFFDSANIEIAHYFLGLKTQALTNTSKNKLVNIKNSQTIKPVATLKQFEELLHLQEIEFYENEQKEQIENKIASDDKKDIASWLENIRKDNKKKQLAKNKKGNNIWQK